MDGESFDAATLCVGDVLRGWRDDRPTELRSGGDGGDGMGLSADVFL